MLIDCGAKNQGSIGGRLRVAEIWHGRSWRDHARAFGRGRRTGRRRWSAARPTRSSLVLRANAGWRLCHDDGAINSFARFGPGARAGAARTAVRALGYRQGRSATLVLESATPPPPAIVAKVAQDCGVDPGRLTFIYAPTQSLAGSVQVVRRSLEVALHKRWTRLSARSYRDGVGAAPLWPPHPDFFIAMGAPRRIILPGRCTCS